MVKEIVFPMVTNKRYYHLLKLIVDEEDNCCSNLYKKYNVHRVTILYQLKRLLKNGYIIQFRNRHKVNYTITEKGKVVLKWFPILKPLREKYEKLLLEAISEEQPPTNNIPRLPD